MWMCAGAWGVQCVGLCAFLPEQSCRSMSSVTEVEEGGPSRLRREGWSDLLSSVSLCVVAVWSRDSASGILEPDTSPADGVLEPSALFGGWHEKSNLA